jgi:ribosomal protein S9
MRMSKIAAATTALLLAAGCDVTVNNESIENQADVLGDRLENAAESAGNGIEQVAEAVENRADDLGNVDIDVDVRGDGNVGEASGNKSAP